MASVAQNVSFLRICLPTKMRFLLLFKIPVDQRHHLKIDLMGIRYPHTCRPINFLIIVKAAKQQHKIPVQNLTCAAPHSLTSVHLKPLRPKNIIPKTKGNNHHSAF